MTIGPVVGHARINTNLSLDSSSIGNMGDRIATQLSRIGERNGRIYRKLGRDAVVAWRAALGLFVSSAPWMGAAVSAVAATVTMLAGSLHSLFQSAYALYPVLGSMAVAAGTLAIGMRGFMDAVRSTDPTQLAANLAKLTPSAQDAALAFRSLSDEASTLRASVQEAMFTGLSDDIEKLGGTLFPVLTEGLTKMAVEWNNLAVQVLNYLNSASGLQTITGFLDGSASVFGKLKDAVVPFLDGMMKLFIALVPAGERLADRITGVAEAFQSWTSAEGFGDRINTMMEKAEKTAGLLLGVIGNLGGILANVFSAANDETNDFLTTLLNLTQRFEDWTESVAGEASISKWADDANRVMEQVGDTLGAVFEVVKELASADALISFLKTVEEAFDYLAKLPLEAIVDKFVELAEVFRPISGPILAFIIAGAALNIMLGNLMGQIGGAVAVVMGAAGKFTSFFATLSGGAKGATGLSKVTAVIRGLGDILAKGLKFAGLAGLVVWVGTLIAKSQHLQDKFKTVWEKVKGVFESLKGAFDEISAALGPAITQMQPFFDLLDKIGSVVVAVVLDAIIAAIQGIADVISGVGSIIAGFITMLTGLFTWNPALMLEGWNQFVSGLAPLISGLWTLLVAFFAPAKFLKLGSMAFKALGGGFKTAGSWVISAVSGLVGRIIAWVAKLPGKLLTLGKSAVRNIATGIRATAGQAITAAKYVFNGILNWIKQLPGRLFSLAQESIGRMAGIIRSDARLVLTAAKNIFDGVINALKQLPGRLFSLGKSAMSKLTGAVSSGASTVGAAAGRVLNAAVNAVKSLPGKLSQFGRDAMSKLSGAIRSGVSSIASAAGRIVGAVTGAISSLPGKMRNIGSNIINGIVNGIKAGIGRVKAVAGRVASTIKNFLPGSPVKEGPLVAWNAGGGAEGGGRNIVDAIVGGLSDISPIRNAMNDVSAAVRDSMTPGLGTGGRIGSMATVGAGAGGTTIRIENLTMPIEVADLESLPRLTSVLEGLAMKVRQGVRVGE